MFDLLQMATKVIIIAAILIVAVFAAAKVWRADLDIGRILSPKRAVQSSVDEKLSWLATRERDGLYQGGRLVSKVTGPTVDEARSEIRFNEIYQSNELNLGAEFEFQKWRLKFRAAESIVMISASAPQKGRIIEKVVCQITGVRSAI